MSARPRIAITTGDPAGIGPEIADKAARDPRVLAACVPLVYGAGTTCAPGELSAAAGQAAYETIVRAVRDAQAGGVQAMATAPINKKALALAGLPWKGHTDMLAALTNTPDVAMMFHSDKLRVVLATIHIPLSEVPVGPHDRIASDHHPPDRARDAAVRAAARPHRACRPESSRRRAGGDRPRGRERARPGGERSAGRTGSTCPARGPVIRCLRARSAASSTS